MTGQIEGRENKDGSSKPYLRCSASWAPPLISSRYPNGATEVPCSDMADSGNPRQFIQPAADTVMISGS
jgi:hypothetical protein